MKPLSNRSRHHRGSMLIAALAFIGITSVITAGILTLATAHYSRSRTEANYAAALDAAEAGANYELRKVSDDASQADSAGTTGGVQYTLPEGTFKVYCTSRTGGNWTVGTPMYIYSSGTVHGLTRTVQLAAKPLCGTGADNYVLYGVNSGTLNGSASATGDIGSNGLLAWNGGASVTGKAIFNGPGAGWAKNPGGNITSVYNTTALAWPTVETLAANAFPLGGLSWLATNNDNALSGISNDAVNLSGSSQFTFQSKAGGANYYLTSLSTKGASSLYFANSLGPITIWVGPSGASTSVTINGAMSAVAMSQDPTKMVKFYFATTGNVTWNGAASLDAGIYNVNNAGTGAVVIHGSSSLLGQIIANSYTIDGANGLQYEGSYFPSPGASYYGMDNALFEDNGAWN
ncbi:MAG: hypothetical protein KGJ62_08515 [Armatimonadetes bacterium]|nr:hypothetical protein [Armatimonadota bacterium]MDE2205065.1 hypothetical protein [Armatimonadota bacterium]